MIFIGVRFTGDFKAKPMQGSPPLAKIVGTMLNGLFFENLDSDLERLRHINKIIGASQAGQKGAKFIRCLQIQPSRDLGEFAGSLAAEVLPKILHFLLGGLGSINDSAELASYLLFDHRYTGQLVELGYEDTIKRKVEILKFWDETQGSIY
jgi:NTE family protein